MDFRRGARAPEKFMRNSGCPLFHRTLSEWVNLLLQTGFILEYMNEPHPDDETVKQVPYIQDSQVVAYFLHVRGRKPG